VSIIFRNLEGSPDFTRIDCTAFQVCLEGRYPPNPAVIEEEAIGNCGEELTSATQEASATSAPRRRPHDVPRPPFPARTQEEMRPRNRRRKHWQITRDPALEAQINRLHMSVSYQLNEWRNKHWIDGLESLESEDKSLRMMMKEVL
jgi:hypothetical protein